MASNGDDLDFNTFYKCLNSTFKDKFERAQKNCWIICIPSSHSTRGLKFTEKFVDCHILKPSPYFKSHFITTDREQSRSCEIDGSMINTKEGPVRILSEELGYNKEYKSFKLFIIEKPLDPRFWKNEIKALELPSQRQCKNFTFSECKEFLLSFPEHRPVLQKFDRKLKQFSNSYMILAQYLHDTSCKVRDLINSGSRSLLDSHHPLLDPQDPIAIEILICLECYVMNSVHHNVYTVCKKKCEEEDFMLTERLQRLHCTGLTPDQLGLNSQFCCPTPSAIVELASLDTRTSPAEKLYCLKSTLELLSDDIQRSFQESYVPLQQNADIPQLTSDDLIPLLVTILVQVRPQHLESNLYYVQNFCWQLSKTDKFGFSLVTFQAAKEYIKTYDFTHLLPSQNKLKKEISLEELMAVAVEMQQNDRKNKVKSPSSEPRPSVFDRQLQKVTRMIEASTIELREQTQKSKLPEKKKIQRLNHTQPDDDLGEFLSGLQKNSLGFTSGKQY